MKLLAPLIVAAATSAAGANTPAADAGRLQQMVSGKTWAIAFYGDLGDRIRTAYWDFTADGKVCARLANNPRGTPCADTGTWRIEGDQLCWQLEFLGKTDGFQSTCGRVKAVGDAYQFINPKSDVSLMTFRPQ